MNYSKQREIILDIMKDNYSHPTAYEIYELAKQVDDKISKSTIYRNLDQLVTHGDLIKIPCSNGFDRYDMIRQVHSHAICKSCGRVFDVVLNSLDKVKKEICNQAEFYPSDDIIVTGVCIQCKEGENK